MLVPGLQRKSIKSLALWLLESLSAELVRTAGGSLREPPLETAELRSRINPWLTISS